MQRYFSLHTLYRRLYGAGQYPNDFSPFCFTCKLRLPETMIDIVWINFVRQDLPIIGKS